LDRTYWKEIDYIAISTNYKEHGFRFLEPEIEWPAEAPRVTAMELPFVPYLAALLYPVFGVNALSVRAITLGAFVLMVVYVFRLARREVGATAAVIAAAAGAMMPLYHQFGRILFSEPVMIAASVACVYHVAEWIEHGRRRDHVLGMLALSLAVCLKLTPLYLLLPIGWLGWRASGMTAARYRALGIGVAAALVPAVLWYGYAYFLTQTSIDVFGIFTGHDKLQSRGMLSDPEWYRVMFGRVGWDILAGKVGQLAVVMGVVGLALLQRGGAILAYLVSILAFFGIVAEGQIDAPYRQLTIIPPLACLIGVGAVAGAAAVGVLMKGLLGRRLLKERVRVGALLLGVLLVGWMGERHRDEVLWRDPGVPMHGRAWRVAREIEEHRQPGDLLIGLGLYSIHKGGNALSPVLYYYTGLRGWTLQADGWSLAEVHRLKARGATLLVAVAMEREATAVPFLDSLRLVYPVLYEEGGGTFMLDLRSQEVSR
jgi:hypothetical protein